MNEPRMKVTVDLPRRTVDFLSNFGFIPRVRDGHDKRPASIEAFRAVGGCELVNPGIVRLEITPRGLRRLVEWLDEMRDEFGSEIAEARRATVEAIKELDAKPSK